MDQCLLTANGAYIQQLLKWLISSISDITSFRLIIVILSNFYIDIYTQLCMQFVTNRNINSMLHIPTLHCVVHHKAGKHSTVSPFQEAFSSHTSRHRANSDLVVQ